MCTYTYLSWRGREQRAIPDPESQNDRDEICFRRWKRFFSFERWKRFKEMLSSRVYLVMAKRRQEAVTDPQSQIAGIETRERIKRLLLRAYVAVNMVAIAATATEVAKALPFKLAHYFPLVSAFVVRTR